MSLKRFGQSARHTKSKQLLPILGEAITLQCGMDPPHLGRCGLFGRSPGGASGATCTEAPREVAVPREPMSPTGRHGKKDVCSSLILPSASPATYPLEVSILSVVLREVQPPSVVHAEYKLQVRCAGRTPWMTRRRCDGRAWRRKHTCCHFQS